MTRVLITGVSGQDGCCLTELLLARGDEVIGVVTPGESWLAAQPPTLVQVRLLVADMRDSASLVVAVEAAQPEEVYNLAAVLQRGRLWDELELANDLVGFGGLDSRRDWGHAADYVRAMTLMLAHPEPADDVVASGTTHSALDPLDVSFAVAAVENWEPFVVQDPALLRPAEPDPLCGDATRARTVLGWQPEHDFTSLVSEMVLADLAELSRS